MNVNAASDVVRTARSSKMDTVDPNDPETFTNSTSITIFDDLGNPTIATVYFIKTQLLRLTTRQTNTTRAW